MTQIRETNAVSIKLLPFWPKDPVIWFAQAEASFRRKSITSELTKFDYFVMTLAQETALQGSVRDNDNFQITPYGQVYADVSRQSQQVTIDQIPG